LLKTQFLNFKVVQGHHFKYVRQWQIQKSGIRRGERVGVGCRGCAVSPIFEKKIMHK